MRDNMMERLSSHHLPQEVDDHDGDDEDDLFETCLYLPPSSSPDDTTVQPTNTVLRLPTSFQAAHNKNCEGASSKRTKSCHTQQQMDCNCQAVDEYLATVPSLERSRRAFIQANQQVVRYSSSPQPSNDERTTYKWVPPPRILYIGQGELAHACPSQADVLVSDRATTCHVLILRSTPPKQPLQQQQQDGETEHVAADTEPLVSCSHVDGLDYEACLREMFHRHVQHYCQNNQSVTASTESSNPKVLVDIHLVGGFLDQDGQSQDLSNWLLYQLTNLAWEYRHVLHCTLKTCIVSSLNNQTLQHASPQDTPPSLWHPTGTVSSFAPWARSLACELSTGRVFLAWCHASVMGPDPLIRHARMWCSGNSTTTSTTTTSTSSRKRLVTVWSPEDPHFTIPPFVLSSTTLPIPYLLSLSDEDFLTMTSTSPDCEEDDFCEANRQTFSFIWKCVQEKAQGRYEPLLEPYEHVPRRYIRAVSKDSTGAGTANNDWILLPPTNNAT